MCQLKIVAIAGYPIDTSRDFPEGLRACGIYMMMLTKVC
jgi:hypothetical protein